MVEDLGLYMQVKKGDLLEVSTYLDDFNSSILIYQSSPEAYTFEWRNNYNEFLELYQLFFDMGWIYE